MSEPLPPLAGIRPGLWVFISAGAAGIGRATADLLLSQRARVWVSDMDEAALADFRAAHPGAPATRADVSDEDAMAALFAAVARDWGGLDALVNNAGIAGPTGGVDTISPADWRRCIEVELTGQFLCAQFAVPLPKAAGGGTIVTMSSAAGRFGHAFRTPSAAKGG